MLINTSIHKYRNVDKNKNFDKYELSTMVEKCLVDEICILGYLEWYEITPFLKFL